MLLYIVVETGRQFLQGVLFQRIVGRVHSSARFQARSRILRYRKGEDSMDGLSPVVQYKMKGDEGRVAFHFQDETVAEVSVKDVQRSHVLLDLMQHSSGSSFTLQSTLECKYLQIWAAAVQHGCTMLQASAHDIAKVLEAVDFIADEKAVQRVGSAFMERLLPPGGTSVDADFLRELESWNPAIAGKAIAAAAVQIGELMWRLPSNLHQLVPAIKAAVIAAEDSRNTKDGQLVTAVADLGKITGVSVSPDGQWLATTGECASNDWRTTISHVATAAISIRTLSGHIASIKALAWSPDGTMLASGSADTTARVYDVATGAAVSVLQGHAGVVLSVAWSPDGRQLCTGSYDSTVRIWDMATGDSIHVLEEHTTKVRSVRWTPNGSSVVSVSTANDVRVWTADTGTIVKAVQNPSEFVESVAWSPDCTMFASNCLGGLAQVLEASTSAETVTLEGTETVLSIAWSSDGSRIVTGSEDGRVVLWDVASGVSTHVLREADDAEVNAVAWSPCGGLVFAVLDFVQVRIFSTS